MKWGRSAEGLRTFPFSRRIIPALKCAGYHRGYQGGHGKTAGGYLEIPDRREAIRWCLTHAEDGDIIVLAGKGHEDYQEIEGKKYPFDERVVIRGAFGKRKAAMRNYSFPCQVKLLTTGKHRLRGLLQNRAV